MRKLTLYAGIPSHTPVNHTGILTQTRSKRTATFILPHSAMRSCHVGKGERRPRANDGQSSPSANFLEAIGAAAGSKESLQLLALGSGQSQSHKLQLDKCFTRGTV